MQTIEEAMEAVRTVESDRDYTRQQMVSVAGSTDTKLGAYGILKSKWAQLAADSGYAGADWHDPKAQDVIAREKLQRDYEQLGSWEMAALAFRYGTQAARALSKAGYIEPKSIEDAGYKNMGKYVRALRAQQPQTDAPVEGRLVEPVKKSAISASPTNNRAEDIIRQQLRAMHNAQKKQSTSVITDTNPEPDLEPEAVEPEVVA